MGEVLRFPDRGLGSGQPVESSQEGLDDRALGGGVEHDPASGGRPRASRAVPSGREDVTDGLERRTGPGRARREGHPSGGPSAERPGDEPRWAVPGVDADAPVPIEPTCRSRRAENVALAALTRHDASEGEIRAKLVAKGLEDDAVEGELERLRTAGLVDDAAFATRLVDRLRERKGLGDAAIRSTLRGRLVPQQVIDVVLAEQVEDEDTAEARLQEVAEDRARRLTSLPYEVAERRLLAFLMRKGHSGSAARAAARSALDAAGIR